MVDTKFAMSHEINFIIYKVGVSLSSTSKNAEMTRLAKEIKLES